MSAPPAAVPYDAGELADLAAVARIDAVPTILKVVSEALDLRLALVARVTDDRWTACAVLDRMSFGLEVGDRLEVATTLCSEVRDSHVPIIIEHASAEPEFCGHPTPKMYGFESYIAVPIFREDGRYFGNVCALDARPAKLRDPRTLAMVELFAELISLQLRADEASERDRAALSSERETAELREQFMAVLSHDLRNPLAAVLAGATLLRAQPLQPAHHAVVDRVHGSALRMSSLIDDLTDLARGRMGGGVMAIRRERTDVASLATGVVDEIAAAHPARALRVVAAGAGVARFDETRVAQLLSNLVANAVQHGAPDTPIVVVVSGHDAHVTFAVTSQGMPIPAETMPRLFHPYVRGTAAGGRSGLGLGLYIASEIARAHGGTIAAASTALGETTFTATLPRSGMLPS